MLYFNILDRQMLAWLVDLSFQKEDKLNSLPKYFNISSPSKSYHRDLPHTSRSYSSGSKWQVLPTSKWRNFVCHRTANKYIWYYLRCGRKYDQIWSSLPFQNENKAMCLSFSCTYPGVNSFIYHLSISKLKYEHFPLVSCCTKHPHLYE